MPSCRTRSQRDDPIQRQGTRLERFSDILPMFQIMRASSRDCALVEKCLCISHTFAFVHVHARLPWVNTNAGFIARLSRFVVGFLRLSSPRHDSMKWPRSPRSLFFEE